MKRIQNKKESTNNIANYTVNNTLSNNTVNNTLSNNNSLQFYESFCPSTTFLATFKSHVESRVKLLKNVEASKYFQQIENKNDDLIKHFYTMLVCANAEWSMKWFVSMETKLFRRRIENIGESEINEIFFKKFGNSSVYFSSKDEIVNENYVNNENDIRTNPNENDISTNPNKILHDIKRLSLNKNSIDNKKWIHWSWIPEIISDLRLIKGYSELTLSTKKAALSTLFRLKTEKKIQIIKKNLIKNSDERISAIYNQLFNEAPPSSSSLEDLENLAPNCITSMMNKLKTTKHLKYFDRQNLTLFLKNAGVPLNDTIQYFRAYFNKNDFDKEYLYSIRHNYGLEGKKANYSGFTCKRIIGSNGNAGCTGCPIKESDPQAFCSQICNKNDGVINSPVEFFKLMKKNSENKIKESTIELQ